MRKLQATLARVSRACMEAEIDAFAQRARDGPDRPVRLLISSGFAPSEISALARPTRWPYGRANPQRRASASILVRDGQRDASRRGGRRRRRRPPRRSARRGRRRSARAPGAAAAGTQPAARAWLARRDRARRRRACSPAPGRLDQLADALGVRRAARSRAGRASRSSGERSRARISGSVTVPSSRSVPRRLPVRSRGPGDVEHVVEQLEGEADGVAERPERAGRRRTSAPSSQAAREQPRGLQLAALEVALERDVGAPGVGALHQLAAGERRRRRARARAAASTAPLRASSAKALENSRSPVAVAASRPAAA